MTLFLHFFAVVARLWRESAVSDDVFWRTWTKESVYLFLFLNFDTAFKNSPPEKNADIWGIERDGISVTNWLKTGGFYSLQSVFGWSRSHCALSRVGMTPGRLSRWNEFTPVPSHGSAFVYMIPPQNVTPTRVTLAWFHPGCCPGARISLRYEISQRYHVNTKRPHVSVWNRSASRLDT